MADHTDGRDIIRQQHAGNCFIVLEYKGVRAIVPRPQSKKAAEAVLSNIFANISQQDINKMFFKRHTVTSNGQAVWALLLEEHWERLVVDWDHLRVDTDPYIGLPAWDDIVVRITFKTTSWIMLLPGSCMEAKNRILGKIGHLLSRKNTIPGNICLLAVLLKDRDGDEDLAYIPNEKSPDEHWRKALSDLKRSHPLLTIRVLEKQRA